MAGQILEQLRAGVHGRSISGAPVEPRLVLRRLHGDNAADHPGMLGAAVLRTEEMVRARLRRLEPERIVAAGNDVSLHPEGRDVKAVDHVLGSHDQLHGAADRHVQLVDLALPPHVLDLPHPLFADNEDLHRARRHPIQIEEHLRAPAEHAHGNDEWNDGPQQLEGERTMDGDADLVAVTPAVPDRENDDQACDQQRKKRGDRHHEEVDGVDLPRLCRGLLRKQRKIRGHRQVRISGVASLAARSRRRLTVRNDRNTSTVAMAPRRTRRSTAAPYCPVAGS